MSLPKTDSFNFSLSELIANDLEVSPHLQVVMVENYKVTAT